MNETLTHSFRRRTTPACFRLLLVLTLAAEPVVSLRAQNPPNATPTAPTAPTTNAVPPPTTPAGTNDEIQLSFQGANIDMIVQWLAEKTGKSVIKHPQVNCQVTISSPKKVTLRQGIDLIYQSLELQGFTAVESADTILIVPEGKEPKTSPPLIPDQAPIPEGRQRMIKIFSLVHAQAADLQDKARLVLSEKASVDVDSRANQLIITDYNDNLRMAGELLKELDVSTPSDSTIKIYPLKYAEAEELGNLISLILNQEALAPGSSSHSTSGGSSRPPISIPGMPITIGRPPESSSSSHSSSGSGGGTSAASEGVHIWPDKTANRLIVSAPKAKLADVERLIKILDTNKPEDVAVRVIALQHMTAPDLVKEIGPLYQKMSGQSLKDMIEVSSDEQSNSLIVLSSELNFIAIQKLVASLDTEDAQDKVMKTFTLKNAEAADVAKQLQDLNTEPSSNSRYGIIMINPYGNSGGGKSKKMTVVADRRRNAVIVQAPPSQMDSVERMIKELDEPVKDDSLAPKIFLLKYVSAADIEDVLNELFLKKQQNRSYYDYFYGDYNQSDNTDRDVGRLYGKVRITSEPYSNAIIVTSNSKENLAVVERILEQLDVPSQAGESTLRVGLKYANASTVAKSINILFAKNGSPPLRPNNQQQPNGVNPQPQQQQAGNVSSQAGFDLEEESKEEGYFPWLGGPPDNTRNSDGRSTSHPVSDLVGRVRAVADDRSNALLISANVHFFPQVLKLLDDLDAPTAQVMIEARIIEVSSDFLDKLGVRWSPDGSQVFTADDYDNSILAHTQAQYQKGFGGNTTINNAATASPATAFSPASLLASVRSGVVDSTISLDYLVQFLRKNTDATVLGEPQINIRDNETGRLFVGQQVPIPSNTQVSSVGSQNTSITYKNVGVKLEVTPHINSTGDVELRIHAESSTVVAGTTVLGGAVFDTRNFRTDLRAKDGQTLVLGGIIQKQISDTMRKTPILGSIPGLGWAFKKKDKISHEVELMVFLRPRVVRTAEDADQLLDEYKEKTPSIQKWLDDSQKTPKKE